MMNLYLYSTFENILHAVSVKLTPWKDICVQTEGGEGQYFETVNIHYVIPLIASAVSCWLWNNPLTVSHLYSSLACNVQAVDDNRHNQQIYYKKPSCTFN